MTRWLVLPLVVFGLVLAAIYLILIVALCARGFHGMWVDRRSR
jgi:hypothetical protein